MKTNTGSDEVNEMMPMRKLFPYAVQHIFAMFTGTIAVPIVISQVLKLSQEDTTLLIAAAIFVSGVGTLIQSLSITKYVGVSLPLILGTSFVAMPPVFIIASRFGGGLNRCLMSSAEPWSPGAAVLPRAAVRKNRFLIQTDSHRLLSYNARCFPAAGFVFRHCRLSGGMPPTATRPVFFSVC